MFQFMDESFIVMVRLPKGTGYKYNITIRIVIIPIMDKSLIVTNLSKLDR